MCRYVSRAALAVAALFVLPLVPAQAAEGGPAPSPSAPCTDRAMLGDTLKEQFRENVFFAGVIDNGSLVEVFTSEEGTWTLALTTPQGVSCLIADGTGWQDAEKPLQPASYRFEAR